jgi:hypothetical protein
MTRGTFYFRRSQIVLVMSQAERLEKIALTQREFALLFGLSKRTLEHWDMGGGFPAVRQELS